MKLKYYIIVVVFALTIKCYCQVNIKYLNAYNNQISNLIDNGNYELAQKRADSLFIFSKAINYTEGIAEVPKKVDSREKKP